MLFLLYVDDLANCLNVVFAKIFAHARHNKHLGKELYRAPTNFNSDLITESCPFLRANTKIKFMVHCNWFSAKKKKTKKKQAEGDNEMHVNIDSETVNSWYSERGSIMTRLLMLKPHFQSGRRFP